MWRGDSGVIAVWWSMSDKSRVIMLAVNTVSHLPCQRVVVLIHTSHTVAYTLTNTHTDIHILTTDRS